MKIYTLDEVQEKLIGKIGTFNCDKFEYELKMKKYFTSEGKKDVTDELSEDDKAELINMVNEPFGFDTISKQDLDEAIRQQGTK